MKMCERSDYVGETYFVWREVWNNDTYDTIGSTSIRTHASGPDYVPIVMVHFCHGRDTFGYSEAVTYSNYRVLLSMLRENETPNNLWKIVSYTNSDDIAINADAELPEWLAEVIDGLEDYPVIDEADMSEVEAVFIDEWWEVAGIPDLRRDIARLYWPGLEDKLDTLEDSKLLEGVYHWYHVTGTWPELEFELVRWSVEDWDALVLYVGRWVSNGCPEVSYR